MQFDLLDQDEFERRYLMYSRGEFTIDEVFPMLSKNARYFIKSGLTLKEWDQHYDQQCDLPTDQSSDLRSDQHLDLPTDQRGEQ